MFIQAYMFIDIFQKVHSTLLFRTTRLLGTGKYINSHGLSMRNSHRFVQFNIKCVVPAFSYSSIHDGNVFDERKPEKTENNNKTS